MPHLLPPDPEPAARRPVAGPGSLAHRRVLVVDDDLDVALVMEEMLAGFGCVSGGIATDFESALHHARRSRFDVALLDVNLGGREVWPVADAIVARGLCFVFVTGADPLSLGDAHPAVPRLQKPFRSALLRAALIDVLGSNTQAKG